MQETVRIALDAMGGDNAPAEMVKGAVEAVNARENIKVFLVGKEEEVRACLSGHRYPEERLAVVPASEVITTEEAPVMAIRKRRIPPSWWPRTW